MRAAEVGEAAKARGEIVFIEECFYVYMQCNYYVTSAIMSVRNRVGVKFECESGFECGNGMASP